MPFGDAPDWQTLGYPSEQAWLKAGRPLTSFKPEKINPEPSVMVKDDYSGEELTQDEFDYVSTTRTTMATGGMTATPDGPVWNITLAEPKAGVTGELPDPEDEPMSDIVPATAPKTGEKLIPTSDEHQTELREQGYVELSTGEFQLPEDATLRAQAEASRGVHKVSAEMSSGKTGVWFAPSFWLDEAGYGDEVQSVIDTARNPLVAAGDIATIGTKPLATVAGTALGAALVPAVAGITGFKSLIEGNNVLDAAQTAASSAIKSVETGYKVGGAVGGTNIADVFFPRNIDELFLEFIPGIGFVPDIARSGRRVAGIIPKAARAWAYPDQVPEFLYHGTVARRAGGIAAEGPNAGTWLSIDPNMAAATARNQAIMTGDDPVVMTFRVTPEDIERARTSLTRQPAFRTTPTASAEIVDLSPVETRWAVNAVINATATGNRFATFSAPFARRVAGMVNSAMDGWAKYGISSERGAMMIGLNPPSELSGTFAPSLPNMGDVKNQVVTAKGPAGRVVGIVGINPSLNRETEIGKYVTAYQSMQAMADGATELAVSAALDPHARIFTGTRGHIFKISDEGMVDVTRRGAAPPRGALGPTLGPAHGIKGRVHLYDVMSEPQNYELNAAQQAYVRDYRQVVDEMENIRVAAGLEPRAKDATGWFYVPRQTKRSGGGYELTRPSKASLDRLYDTATEAWSKGVLYDADPRSVLQLHVRNAYEEVIQKQLDDSVATIGIKADKLIEKMEPGLIKKRLDAKKELDLSRTLLGRTKVSRPMAAAESRIRRAAAQKSKDVITQLKVARDALRKSSDAYVGLTPQMKSQFAAARRAADKAFNDAMNEIVQINKINLNAPKTGPRGSRTPVKGRQIADGVTMSRDQISIVRKALRLSQEEADLIHRTLGQDVSSEVTARLLQQRQELRNAKDALDNAAAVLTPPARLRSELKAARAAAETRLSKAQARFATIDEKYQTVKEAALKAHYTDASLFGGQKGTDIGIRSWKGKIVQEDDFRLLEDVAPQFGSTHRNPGAWLARNVGKVANMTRFLASVGDFAAPFIHGLPLLAQNPVRWSQATFLHYAAFVDPAVQARFMRDHITSMQEMARNGVPIGDAEFFQAMREGQTYSAGKLVELFAGKKGRAIGQNVGRQTFGRFQASYGTLQTVARTLMWEGSRMQPKAKAQWIRNMTGGLDTRALGVTRNQRDLEGLWLAFSPRLMRSTLALLADAAQGANFMNLTSASKRAATAHQRAALRSMSQLMGGATAAYVAWGVGMGRSPEEIQEGLNPLNGKKFLSYQVNDDWIGIGGQVRSMVQLMGKLGADAVRVSNGETPTLFTLDQFENPLIAYYYSRGAPAMNIVGGAAEGAVAALGGDVDILPYENIDNLPDLGKHIATSALPFAIQAHAEAAFEPTIVEKPLTSIVGLSGGRTSAQTPGELRDKRRLEGLEKLAGDGTFQPQIVNKLKTTPSHEWSSTERKIVDGWVEQKYPDEAALYDEFRRYNENIFQATTDRADTARATSAVVYDNLLKQFQEGVTPIDKIWDAYNTERNKLAGRLSEIYSGDSEESKEYLAAIDKLQPTDIRKVEDDYNAIVASVFEKTAGALTDKDWDKIAEDRLTFLENLYQADPAMAERLLFNLEAKENIDRDSAHPLTQLRKKAQETLKPYYEMDTDTPEGRKARSDLLAKDPNTDIALYLTATWPDPVAHSIQGANTIVEMFPNKEVKLANSDLMLTPEVLTILNKYDKQITRMITLPSSYEGTVYANTTSSPRTELRKQDPLYDALYFVMGYSKPQAGKEYVFAYHPEAVASYLNEWGIRRTDGMPPGSD